MYPSSAGRGIDRNLSRTTIRQDFPLVGKLLAENLIQSFRIGVVTNVITPVELVV